MSIELFELVNTCRYCGCPALEASDCCAGCEVDVDPFSWDDVDGALLCCVEELEAKTAPDTETIFLLD